MIRLRSWRVINIQRQKNRPFLGGIQTGGKVALSRAIFDLRVISLICSVKELAERVGFEIRHKTYMQRHTTHGLRLKYMEVRGTTWYYV
jgi:hypothetical protein